MCASYPKVQKLQLIISFDNNLFQKRWLHILDLMKKFHVVLVLFFSKNRAIQTQQFLRYKIEHPALSASIFEE